jgi:KDO2-lipid IV(A) lauroyltransferase
VKKIWHLLIHISFRTLLFVVRVVPRPIMYFWAASLGSLGYALSKRYRGVGMRNLDIAYGDKLTVEQKKKIVKQVFRNFAKSTLVEFPGVSAFGKNDVLRSIDIEPGMVSRLKEYQARGKGIIAVSGHIGNFELAARRMVIEGFKFAVVARNDPNPVMTTLINAVRNSGGYEVIGRGDAARPILRMLRSNGIVAILSDQTSRDIYAPFFGVLSGTVAGPAALALRTGAVLVPIFCIRDGINHHRVLLYPEIDVHSTGDHKADTVRIMSDVNAAVEDVVRKYPEQWLWLHNRWRDLPTKEEEAEWEAHYSPKRSTAC